jgi:hypothetical protein
MNKQEWIPTDAEPDPCNGRDCNECEIGGCDHGVEVR